MAKCVPFVTSDSGRRWRMLPLFTTAYDDDEDDWSDGDDDVRPARRILLSLVISVDNFPKESLSLTLSPSIARLLGETEQWTPLVISQKQMMRGFIFRSPPSWERIRPSSIFVECSLATATMTASGRQHRLLRIVPLGGGGEVISFAPPDFVDATLAEAAASSSVRIRLLSSPNARRPLRFAGETRPTILHLILRRQPMQL